MTNSLDRDKGWGHPVVLVFFGLLFILGLFIYNDYGISVDEAISRDNGMVTLKHVAKLISPSFVANDPAFNNVEELATYHDRDYGVLFEATVCLVERLFHVDDFRSQFLLRHLMTFFVCFGGVVAVYQLGARRFNNWRIGLLVAVWLVLSPRLFAEFFYNDKDAVFMALFAVAINTGVRFLLQPSFKRGAWHALACMAAIDVRIMGVLLPMLTVSFLVVQVLHGQVKLGKALQTGLFYLVLTSVLVVAFWPYLWSDPVGNLVLAFNNMKNFRWTGQVLYLGEAMPATNIPWHYALFWISVSTPILYLAGFLLGVGAVLFRLLQRNWRLWQGGGEMQDVLFLAVVVGPLFAVIFFHSVLYDGWRQLYFIYPAMLLIALRGWLLVWHWRPANLGFLSRNWSSVVLLVVGASMGYVLLRMVRAHPYQNVYFNAFAGKNIESRLEVDYWGLSYRKGLEYIVSVDHRPQIKIMAPAWQPIELSVNMLPLEDRKRIMVVQFESGEAADYLITNYRWHPEPYTQGPEIKSFKTDGVRLYSIFWLAKTWWQPDEQ